MADNKQQINLTIKQGIQKQSQAKASSNQQTVVNQQQSAIKQPTPAIPDKSQNLNIKDIVNQFSQLKQLISSLSSTKDSTLKNIDKNFQTLISIQQENSTKLNQLSANPNKNNFQITRSKEQINSQNKFIEQTKIFFEDLSTKLQDIKTSLNENFSSETKTENVSSINIDTSEIQKNIVNIESSLSEKLDQLIQKSTNDNIIEKLSAIQSNIGSLNNEQILSQLKSIQQNTSNKIQLTDYNEKIDSIITLLQNKPEQKQKQTVVPLTKEDLDSSIKDIITILDKKNQNLNYTSSIDITNLQKAFNQFLSDLKNENIQQLTKINQNKIQIASSKEIAESNTYDFSILQNINTSLNSISKSISQLTNEKQFIDNTDQINQINSNSITIKQAVQQLTQSVTSDTKSIIQIEQSIQENLQQAKQDLSSYIQESTNKQKPKTVIKQKQKVIKQQTPVKKQSEQKQQENKSIEQSIDITLLQNQTNKLMSNVKAQEQVQNSTQIKTQKNQQNKKQTDQSKNIDKTTNKKLVQRNINATNQKPILVKKQSVEKLPQAQNEPQKKEQTQQPQISNTPKQKQTIIEKQIIQKEIKSQIPLQKKQSENKNNAQNKQIQENNKPSVAPQNQQKTPIIVNIPKSQNTNIQSKQNDKNILQPKKQEQKKQSTNTINKEQTQKPVLIKKYYVEKPQIQKTQPQKKQVIAKPAVVSQTSTSQTIQRLFLNTSLLTQSVISIQSTLQKNLLKEKQINPVLITITGTNENQDLTKALKQRKQQTKTENKLIKKVIVNKIQKTQSQKQIQKKPSVKQNVDTEILQPQKQTISVPQQQLSPVKKEKQKKQESFNPLNTISQTIASISDGIFGTKLSKPKQIKKQQKKQQSSTLQQVQPIYAPITQQQHLNDSIIQISQISNYMDNNDTSIKNQSNNIDLLFKNQTKSDIRQLLKNEEFINLCKSISLEDISKAILMCDDEFKRLNELKADKSISSEKIILQQKQINEIKKQLLVQQKNLIDKQQLQERYDQLNRQITATSLSIAGIKTQNNESIQQPILNLQHTSTNMQQNNLLVSNVLDQSIDTFKTQKSNIQLPTENIIQKLPQKKSEQELSKLKSQAFDRFTSLQTDNDYISQYVNNYIKHRFDYLYQKFPQMTAEQIEKIGKNSISEFTDAWDSGFVLIPSQNGSQFAAVDKDKVLKMLQTSEQTPLSLQGVSVVEQQIQNQPYIQSESQTQKLQFNQSSTQQTPEINVQPTIYFNQQDYMQDKNKYQFDKRVYETEKLDQSKKIQDWKSSGSDEISNLFADIKNNYIPAQINLLKQQQQISTKDTSELFKKFSTMWDQNYSNGTILFVDQNNQIVKTDRQRFLNNYYLKNKSEIIEPIEPKQADYLSTNPPQQQMQKYVPYNEKTPENTYNDQNGWEIEKPIPTQKLTQQKQNDVEVINPQAVKQVKQQSDIYSNKLEKQKDNLVEQKPNRDSIPKLGTGFVSTLTSPTTNSKPFQIAKAEEKLSSPKQIVNKSAGNFLGLSEQFETNLFNELYAIEDSINGYPSITNLNNTNKTENIRKSATSIDRRSNISNTSNTKNSNTNNTTNNKKQSNDNILNSITNAFTNNPLVSSVKTVANNNFVTSTFKQFTTLFDNVNKSENKKSEKQQSGLFSFLNVSSKPETSGMQAVKDYQSSNKEYQKKQQSIPQKLASNITSPISNMFSNLTQNIFNNNQNNSKSANSEELLTGIDRLIQANKPQVIYIYPSDTNEPHKINTFIK